MASRPRKRKREIDLSIPFVVPDQRVTYTHASGDQNVDGLEIKDGALVTAQGSVQLEDGRIVHYPGPNVARFNLIEARKHQVRAKRLRYEVLDGLQMRDREHASVSEMDVLFDFFSAASNAVLMSFVAVEGVANALIDNLPATTEVSVDRKDGPVVIEKIDMIRRLAIAEKLDLIPPLASGQISPKGTAVWERFVHLRRLRDDLVHIKGFGYVGEPTDPQIYGRLLRGDGNAAVQDAARLIDSIAPDWLLDPMRKQLLS